MRVLTAATSLTLLMLGSAPVAQDAHNPDNLYRLGPDSLEQEGVPKGDIRGPFTLPSAVCPETQHTYWVYVPAQYTPSEPASLLVFNTVERSPSGAAPGK